MISQYSNELYIKENNQTFLSYLSIYIMPETMMVEKCFTFYVEIG